MRPAAVGSLDDRFHYITRVVTANADTASPVEKSEKRSRGVDNSARTSLLRDETRCFSGLRRETLRRMQCADQECELHRRLYRYLAPGQVWEAGGIHDLPLAAIVSLRAGPAGLRLAGISSWA